MVCVTAILSSSCRPRLADAGARRDLDPPETEHDGETCLVNMPSFSLASQLRIGAQPGIETFQLLYGSLHQWRWQVAENGPGETGPFY